MSKTKCVACGHAIDAAAKLCPYCGANPATGEKIDTQAMLQEIFRPRELSTGESVMEFARQRQGVVIFATVVVVFLIFAGVHQFVTMRNRTSVTDSPAVPLTEIADLSNQTQQERNLPMPALEFQYDGRPQTMRTFIVEPGATTPPEVIAAQQAAAAAAAAAKQPPAAPTATAPLAAAPPPPAR